MAKRPVRAFDAAANSKVFNMMLRYVDKTDGCWLWTRSTKNGYGIYSNRGVTYSVHRVFYQQLNGTIPRSLEVDHKCRIRNCVNPDHMELVTHKENMVRAVPYGPMTKTHCKAGHERTPENTIYRKASPKRHAHRTCRICFREVERRFWQKKLNQKLP